MNATESTQTARRSRAVALVLLIAGSGIVLAVAVGSVPWTAGLAVIAGAAMIGAGAGLYARHGGT